MPKSLDIIKQEREAMIEQFTAAMESGEEKAIAGAMAAFVENIQQSIITEANELSAQQRADSEILASRGVRQLTSAEQSFYKNAIEAMSDNNPRQALTNLEVALPETVIEAVFEDMRAAHPLLNLVNFVNTSAAVKMIVNKGEIELAVWGKLGSGYTKQLSGAIDEINTTVCKLSAYIPVAKDMLDLGAAWIDRFVRVILSESIAYAIENAIITGDGDNMPVGMDRIVGDKSTIVGGKYKQKTAKPVTGFDPVTYGELVAALAENADTKIARAIESVCLIVNPVDYYKVIMPATTMLAPNGNYVANIFPVPTTVCQSKYMTKGKAIIGLAKRYFFALGSSKGGKIEYDDSVQFLDDARVYGIKMHGNGMPLDNNAFMLLDITGVKPLRYQVTTYAENAANTAAAEDAANG